MTALVLALALETAIRATPALAVGILIGSVRPVAPGGRHLALAAGLAAFLLVPAVRWIAPALHFSFPGATVEWMLRPGPTVGATAASSAGGVLSAVVQTAAVVWAVGTLLLLGRLLLGLALGHRLVRSARPMGGHAMGRRSSARLLSSGRIHTPVAAGLLAPAVILPDAASSWLPVERRAAIVHERAHLRRGDGWTLLMALLVRALFWPHPGVWLAARRLREASEEACDQAVVASGTDPIEYADLLVRLASRGRAPWLTALAGCSSLSRRVESLLRGRPAPGRRFPSLALAAMVVAITITGAAATSSAADRYARAYAIDVDLAARILAAARAERLEPSLGFGLVSVESGFDPRAISAGGAVGLTQLLPGTAATLVPDVSVDDLRAADLNLRLGFRLLRRMLDEFPGSPDQAVLSYHHGPNRVRQSGLTAGPYLSRLRMAAAAGASTP